MGTKNHIESIARGVVIEQGGVLMCQSIKGGYYYLPGGHIEFGEQARSALIRELQEEAGMSPTVGKLLLTSEHCFHDGKKQHHEINVVFLVEHLDSKADQAQVGRDRTPVQSLEPDIGFEWIDLARVSELDIRPTEIKAWLLSDGRTSEKDGPMITGFDT